MLLCGDVLTCLPKADALCADIHTALFFTSHSITAIRALYKELFVSVINRSTQQVFAAY